MDKTTKKYQDFIKTIGFLKTITTILIIISSVGLIVLGGAPLLENIFQKSISRGVEAKGFGFSLIINGKLENEFPESYFIITHLAGCITIIITIIILIIIRSILKDILKNEEPFIKFISKKLRLISIIMLILTVINWIGEGITYLILTNEEFLSTKVDGIKFSSSVNMEFTIIFISGLIYLLSYIFDYGVELREDNDGIV